MKLPVSPVMVGSLPTPPRIAGQAVLTGDTPSNSYLTIPHHADLTFGSGAFSIAFFGSWGAYVGGEYDAPIGKGDVGSGEWMVRLLGTKKVTFRAGGADHVASATYDPGVWYNTVIKRANTGEISHYRDGGLVASATPSATNLNSSKALNIGCADAASNRVFRGMLDSVGMWKGRDISINEIEWLYNLGVGRAYSELTDAIKTSLVAWWDFDTATGNLIDSHGAHNATEVGTPTYPDLI